MKSPWPLMTMCLAVMLMGCGEAASSSKGFSLPKGDPERGRAAFVELQCHACHRVEGVELPALDGQAETPVVLGGKVVRSKTYGELVTSIINPSHRIAKGYRKDVVEVSGQSRMTNYNDVLTVTQLIDLVAFLEAQYEVEKYDPTDYPIYPMLQ